MAHCSLTRTYSPQEMDQATQFVWNCWFYTICLTGPATGTFLRRLCRNWFWPLPYFDLLEVYVRLLDFCEINNQFEILWAHLILFGRICVCLGAFYAIRKMLFNIDLCTTWRSKANSEIKRPLVFSQSYATTLSYHYRNIWWPCS